MRLTVVQDSMNTRAIVLTLFLLATSACSDDVTSSSPATDEVPAEETSPGPLGSEDGLAGLPAGVWSIESVLDRDGEVVGPSEGEDGYSTRVIITDDGETLMAYDYCGSIPTQVVLSREESFYLADLALDESTSMESCNQMVSADNARFTPVDEATISVSTRGFDVTLRLTDEPCPTFLADGC